MRAGSLFSGYGGLSRAVEEAFGATTAWVADVEPAACRVLERRFPGVPNLGDVTAVDWSAVEPVDIIEGGSPCQDISAAGKRAGMTDGTRSNLWVAMREAIAIIKPTYVIWENVAGALSARAASASDPEPDEATTRAIRRLDASIFRLLRKGTNARHPKARAYRHAVRLMEQRARLVGDAAPAKPVLRAIGRVLGDLAELGFDAEVRSVRASDIGACHQRRRVFILAWHPDRIAGDTASPRPQGPAGRGIQRRQSARADRGIDGLTLPTPRTSDTNGVGAHGTGGLDLRTVVDTLPTPRASEADHPGRRSADHGGQVGLAEAVNTLPTPRATDGAKGGPNQRGSKGDLTLPSAVQLPTPSVADGTGGHERRGGARGDELLLPGIAKAGQWGQYAAAIARHEHALCRPSPEPTIPAKRGGRKLSGEFTEWMMMQPHGWIWDLVLDGTITNNEALKLCGNGVVTPQAVYALRLMLPHVPRGIVP